MADQVVLLRKGSVEQTGAPHELYQRPRTVFAAQFMGSPPMNLLDVARIDRYDALMAACGGGLPADRHAGGFIGVRPEHIQVGNGGLPVQLVAADYLGAETVLRMTHGGQTLFARIDGRHDYRSGDTLAVCWPATAVHHFGADGIRIPATGDADA